MRPTFHRISVREILLIALPVLVLVGGAIAIALHYMQPTPPRAIAIATGGQAGAYYAYAKRYEQVLARSGVKLDVRATAGSLDNLKILEDPNSGVDAAFLQGGISSAKESPGLLSVGRIGHEPLWIFYKGTETLDRLPQMRGKRLAVGPVGSGTRHLVSRLLEPSGVTERTATLLPLGGAEAVTALKDGKIDVVFMVVAVDAPQVQALLHDPEVRAMSLAQADAYARLFPYLTRLVLPQGVVDLVKNVPPADVILVAPAAVLVVRVSLLAQAAAEVHQAPSLFSQASEFPKAVDPEFQMADSAVRFYKNGAPFFQRYLPFWLANLVERLIVLGVPLATVALPLFKFVPWLFKWRVRNRMLKWYASLKEIESRLEAQPTPSQIAVLTADVEQIEVEMNDSPVPLGFSEQFYNLRGHIDLVRKRLTTRVTAAAG